MAKGKGTGNWLARKLAGPTKQMTYRVQMLSYRIAGHAPAGAAEHMDQMLKWAGVRQDPRQWIGAAIILSTLGTVVALLTAWILLGITDLIILVPTGLLMFGLTTFVLYFLVYMRVEDRRKRVERILPDALHMVAENINAGVTPVVALRMVARPEFGPLEDEIKVATAKALGTESFGEALLAISTRIKSDVLYRTMSLFTTCMRSGGNLATLLENSAAEILEAHELRKELIAGTNMYVVFIVFTMVIGMPLLLSISLQFIHMISSLQTQGIGGSFAGELGLSTAAPVSEAFIEQASIVSLIMTAILSSMLIGAIHDGNEWYGIRLAPLFGLMSLTVFFLLRTYLLSMLLGGI